MCTWYHVGLWKLGASVDFEKCQVLTREVLSNGGGCERGAL